MSTPPSRDDRPVAPTPAHHVAYLDGAPQEKPSALAHIAKIAGRKQLAHDLRISKSLLDQMIAGEKHDPIERTRRLVHIAIKYCGSEWALTIARDLLAEVGAGVVSAEQLATIREIAAKN